MPACNFSSLKSENSLNSLPKSFLNPSSNHEALI